MPHFTVNRGSFSFELAFQECGEVRMLSKA